MMWQMFDMKYGEVTIYSVVLLPDLDQIVREPWTILENQTKTAVYVNLGKAVRPEENIWLSITGKKENVRRAREMLQEKLDQFY